ncbi:barrier to autointegration factor [Oesophagostomum dentatum]|uniref:Barrier to autointegration factor n=1 Tax=Oesophagostomum dentatum TaxID=61180 RepID=A0A0B1TUI9_OESDE|nr:barrier to autointegration factor [Oesophagostomum dentatum]
MPKPPTKKHAECTGEPFGDKDVSAIPGIGATYGIRLARKGYDKAYKLYGQFLQLGRDEQLFINFLWDTASIPAANAKSAYNCFSVWASQNSIFR